MEVSLNTTPGPVKLPLAILSLLSLPLLVQTLLTLLPALKKYSIPFLSNLNNSASMAHKNQGLNHQKPSNNKSERFFFPRGQIGWALHFRRGRAGLGTEDGRILKKQEEKVNSGVCSTLICTAAWNELWNQPSLPSLEAVVNVEAYWSLYRWEDGTCGWREQSKVFGVRMGLCEESPLAGAAQSPRRLCSPSLA